MNLRELKRSLRSLTPREMVKLDTWLHELKESYCESIVTPASRRRRLPSLSRGSSVSPGYACLTR